MTNVTNVGDVEDALEAQFKNWPELDGVLFEVGEPIPEDTTKHPWVGLFHVGQNLNARVIGAGPGNRKQNADWAIFFAESDPTSGRLARKRSNMLLQKLLQALLSDFTIGGTALGIGPDITTNFLDVSFSKTAFTIVGRVQFTTLGNTF